MTDPAFAIQRLEPVSSNGKEWYTPDGKPWFMSLKGLFSYLIEHFNEQPFILGQDKMPSGIKDIRETLEKSYDIIVASLDDDGYVTYFGLD